MTSTLAEPRTTARPLPVWPVLMLIVALWGLMMYCYQHRGCWFDPRVYTPYNSFTELASMWPMDRQRADLVQGQLLCHQQCAICHQDSGLGNPLNGCPPLVGSEWVTAQGPNRIIRIVSKGLTGPIEVKGQVWNSGNSMLAVGD